MACFGIEGRPPAQSQSASNPCALVRSFLIPRDTDTQSNNRQDKQAYTQPHTKQVFDLGGNLWRECELTELVIPITDTLPQEGLLMLDLHYLMVNFTLIF